MFPLPLREASWRPAAAPSLTRTLLPWLDDPDGSARAYAVYPDGHLDHHTPPLLAVASTGTLEADSATPFRDHLERHPPRGLWDAAFVVDAFRMAGPPYGAVADLDFEFEPLPLVEDLLRDSRGVLLWDHQLEGLFALFGNDRQASAELRKGINARRAEAFEVAASLVLARGVTIAEVIEERMRFGAVTAPSLYAARVLVELGVTLPADGSLRIGSNRRS